MVDKELFLNTRVLFTIENCHYCRIWKEVIGKLNSNLPVNKRILVIDCTKYHDYGIIDSPLIRAYRKYLGSYPSLFFEGKKVEGANTKVELLAFMNSLLRKDQISPVNMTETVNGQQINLLFDKNCRWVDTFLGKRLVCQ